MNEPSDYISIDPAIRFGKPCIKGTRIAVGDILGWLSSGMNHAEIIEDYPELQEVHILSALAFAAQRDAMTKLVVHSTQAVKSA
ncbi:DUF433 domain-containing protein [Leadbettera azotonutricia]|uniref:Conserved domain protein n=1 Tax=Leadbettera azotonutricia (strain ATCC BAA-888 / DSM 13862 / ZAS-9) TaxID=545695 RepID=F5Y9S4_LEAAZ|nr:DUF433 domain-containing protein [Leadbettera azotonutricia]AEF80836.1 conserved domain protein [Leadbettera azotonutricia ZAS-9]